MQEDGDEIAISDDEVMVEDSSSPPPAYSIPVTNRLLRQTRSEPWQPVPRPILMPDLPPQDFAEVFHRLVFHWLAVSWDSLLITFLILIMDVIFACLKADQRWSRNSFMKILWNSLCSLRHVLPLKCFRNFERLSHADLQLKWEEAHTYVGFSVQLCKVQHQRGLRWCFERPQTASSWSRPCLLELSSMPGVEKVTFHQCRVGLKAPGSEIPIKKATTIMTNARAVSDAFRLSVLSHTSILREVSMAFHWASIAKNIRWKCAGRWQGRSITLSSHEAHYFYCKFSFNSRLTGCTVSGSTWHGKKSWRWEIVTAKPFKNVWEMFLWQSIQSALGFDKYRHSREKKHFLERRKRKNEWTKATCDNLRSHWKIFTNTSTKRSSRSQ